MVMMFGEQVGVKTAFGVAVMHMHERQQLLLTAHYHCREDSLEPVSREVVAGTGGAVVAGTGGVVITTDTKEETYEELRGHKQVLKV